MKNEQKICDPVLISRFFDKELGPEKYDFVKSHIRTCSFCKKNLEELQGISRQVREHFNHQYRAGYAGIEQRVMEIIEKKKISWWKEWKETFFSKKILLPVAATVAICFMYFAVYQTPTEFGPSAIVTSLSGDYSSVIIMETPKTHQTVLWFDEKI